MTQTTKTALITGGTGPDGAYLSEPLPAKRHEAHGVKRRSSLFNTERIGRRSEQRHPLTRGSDAA